MSVYGNNVIIVAKHHDVFPIRVKNMNHAKTRLEKLRIYFHINFWERAK